MKNLKTLELRQNKILSTNQSKRLNKLHFIFLAKNGILFMTLLNFTRTFFFLIFTKIVAPKLYLEEGRFIILIIWASFSCILA